MDSLIQGKTIIHISFADFMKVIAEYNLTDNKSLKLSIDRSSLEQDIYAWYKSIPIKVSLKYPNKFTTYHICG